MGLQANHRYYVGRNLSELMDRLWTYVLLFLSLVSTSVFICPVRSASADGKSRLESGTPFQVTCMWACAFHIILYRCPYSCCEEPVKQWSTVLCFCICRRGQSGLWECQYADVSVFGWDSVDQLVRLIVCLWVCEYLMWICAFGYTNNHKLIT